ncbi:AGE family epimerase/isomerase [Celeribacter sp.]|uniref:AGE family epimerase/isomerase n=1 Tax=Celeribacter sp. TaxID=1890673 RepID=UPI003A8EB8F3
MPRNTWASEAHRSFLVKDALRQFAFFDNSICPSGGFHTLDMQGRPLGSAVQELHTTTRLVHSYSLGYLAGRTACDTFIDHGIRYLREHHHDADFGGYVWALKGDDMSDSRKLAYGHVFVLLAAASAMAAGHPDATALLSDVEHVLDRHFWEEEQGLFCDEWNRDWTPFSTYRGMNANMHGVEALLAAFEATGREKFLLRAGRILEFFMEKMAPNENWRIPEHYSQDWKVDRDYSENPMFRPAGTTPGHSFELARLLLHYGELTGDLEGPLKIARAVVYRALKDAWDAEQGGIVYTLDFSGKPLIRDRYWWPVTEAIGVMAAILKIDPHSEDLVWYRVLWEFARHHFIDSDRGGWFPEIDRYGNPISGQFIGKPDIYHALQATLFPLMPKISGAYTDLRGILPNARGDRLKTGL